jgi:hypothetical protein
MKRCVAGASLILMVASLAVAAHPHTRFRGLDLSEWMRFYFTWSLGGGRADHVGKTVFLPLPAGEPTEVEGGVVFEGHADVALKPGEGFVLPVFIFNGETYLEDVPDDNPADFPAALFTDPELVTVMVVLDGKVIISSETDDLSDYYFFNSHDDPILYAEPIERAPGVHAIGTIWVEGIGFVQPPLSVGEHTLEIFAFSHPFGVGFANTWNITVSK